MAYIRRLLCRLRNVLRPFELEPDLSREVDSHLRMLKDDFERQGLTLVGVAVGNLDGLGATQLELPLDAHSGHELDAALDAVRDKFGSTAVTRGSLVGRDQGLAMPMLPD